MDSCISCGIKHVDIISGYCKICRMELTTDSAESNCRHCGLSVSICSNSGRGHGIYPICVDCADKIDEGWQPCPICWFLWPAGQASKDGCKIMQQQDKSVRGVLYTEDAKTGDIRIINVTDGYSQKEAENGAYSEAVRRGIV